MQAITLETRVAGFQLLEKVGEGSSGEVWRGSDGDRTVAVKFLNASLLERLDHSKHLERFYNEAFALAQLTDLPHVPTLVSYALDVPRPYVVMEFIESPSYAEMIGSGEMMFIPLMQRLQALRKVAGTIYTIHDRGIIHRDIKPGNIHGVEHPYILDFSIAHPASKAGTADKQIGTALYAPPDLLPPTPRTDSYSLGIVVYEVIFGKHPIFDYSNLSKTPEDMRREAGDAIMNERWHKPTTLDDKSLPVNLQGASLERLDQIFQHSMMMSEDRYADVRVLVDDVIKAIHIKENADYIGELPLPTSAIGAEYVDEVEHFTDQLVTIEETKTDIPMEDIQEELASSTRVWILGLSTLFVVLFVVLAIILSSPST